MKTFTPEAATKIAHKTDGTFSEKGMTLVADALASAITDDALTALNAGLSSRNRRTVTLVDIANIAYVHVTSIKENDGYSPYNRIIKWCSKNGSDYDNAHIGLITDILLKIEFIKLLEANTKKGKCKRYEIPIDVMGMLKLT